MNNMDKINPNEHLSFVDEAHVKKGLRGHVQIFRENKDTGEKTLWYEDDNIIPISGYQWILMKMFGLYLDSQHNKDNKYEDLGKDTTVIVPDLNNSGSYALGVAPSSYNNMTVDISDRHFVQGFMIGTGGSGEDAITTKNTDYSFTKLRNPIPFQQTQTSLSADIAGKYLGVLRADESTEKPQFSKSYFIKKFDERPHIYHSWWRDGQRWDYVDPVTQNDLGPDSVNGVGKTNRIESYVECQMSLSEDDCIAYFDHDGSTQTAVVNELGLVAYNTVSGTRSTVESFYNSHIKDFIKIIFDNNRGDDMTENVINMAGEIYNLLTTELAGYSQPNIDAFCTTINEIAGLDKDAVVDYDSIKTALTDDSNIGVEAFYNQNGTMVYTTDKFLEYMSAPEFDQLSTDEAERIKLITYYTFKAIPLEKNMRILINYRIYAN